MQGLLEHVEHVEARAGIDASAYAASFTGFTRWTRDCPPLLLADAAGTTSGLTYYSTVVTQAKRFGREFVHDRDVDTFESIAALDVTDPSLTDIFGHPYQRHALIDGAGVLAARQEGTDFERLRGWAHDAEPGSDAANALRSIRGVGFRTCQYLRMVGGADTIKPDIQVEKFVADVNRAVDGASYHNETDMDRYLSCQQIAAETGYSLLELDQLAWWAYTDASPHDDEEVPPLYDPIPTSD